MITLKVPKDKKDKNDILAWCINTLRNEIKKDKELSGKNKPLGDLELIDIPGAIEYIGLKDKAELLFNIRLYNSKFPENEILSIKIETSSENKKVGEDRLLFIKSDLKDLRAIKTF